MTLPIGSAFGAYLIEDYIGHGGMGEVYRALDTRLNRPVALKVLPNSLANDPDRLTRFETEARVLASLNHRNIGAIYAFEINPLGKALVLELVQGETLAQTIATESISVVEILSIARNVCDAIAEAHRRNIVHRDLKPANIKRGSDGTVKVLDFGLSKLVQDAAGVSALSQLSTATAAGLTAVGTLIGTVAYMSPEQAKGVAVDSQSDIWAFGAIIYELLARAPAFNGPSAAETLSSIQRDDPDWDKLPADIPESLRRLLRRCLAKDTDARYANIKDVKLDVIDAHAEALEYGRSLDVDVETVQRVFAYAPGGCLCQPVISLNVASTHAAALTALDDLRRELSRRDAVDVETFDSINSVLKGFVDAGLPRLREPGSRKQVQGNVVTCYTELLKSCKDDTQIARVCQTHEEWTKHHKGREALRNDTIRWFSPRLINSLADSVARLEAAKLLERVIQGGFNAKSEHERNVVESALFALINISSLESRDLERLLRSGFRVVVDAWSFHEPWAAAMNEAVANNRLERRECDSLHSTIGDHVTSLRWNPTSPQYTVLTKIMAQLRHQQWRPLNCYGLSESIDGKLRLNMEEISCKLINYRVREDESRPGAWLTSEFGPREAQPRGAEATLTLLFKTGEAVVRGKVQSVSTYGDELSSTGQRCGYRFSLDDGQDHVFDALPRAGDPR